MNIPCPVTITCPGGRNGEDDPRANYSSEAPDVIRFGASGWAPGPVRPVLPPTEPPIIPDGYLAMGCKFLCFSSVSQEEADACAAAQAYLCVIGDGDGGGGGGGGGGGVFYNQLVQCAWRCPDGTSYITTIPAGVYPALNQIEANRVAYIRACQQAAAAHMCLSGLTTTSACNGSSFLASASVTGGQSPMLFVVDSGALPTGIVMTSAADGRTVILSGTPTVAGDFAFHILVRDAIGRTLSKLFTISVGGIDQATTLADATEGDPYSAPLTASGMGVALIWTLETGSTLPAGLNLNSASGEIYGTPTEDGDFTFTIEVENYA